MVQIKILILTLLIVIAGCISEEKTVQKSENTKILKVTNGGDMTSWSSVIVENNTIKIGREVLQNYIFDSFINSENIFAIRGEYDKKNMDIGSWLGIQDSDIRLEFKDDELLIDISKLRERAIETGNSIPRWNMNIKIVVFKKSGEMIALASTKLFNITADIKNSTVKSSTKKDSQYTKNVVSF